MDAGLSCCRVHNACRKERGNEKRLEGKKFKSDKKAQRRGGKNIKSWD